MTKDHDTIALHDSEKENKVDVTSLFRGTATVAFVTLIVSGIAALGSFVAYLISRPGGLIENIPIDTAIFLLLLGSMITIFIFLGAVGFFIRVNRRLGRIIIAPNLDAMDLNRPGAKTVIIMYGLAVGLILVMGMWGYWLFFKYYLFALSLTSLSFLALSVAIGVMIMAFLVEIVLIAIGRTATGMVRKILDVED